MAGTGAERTTKERPGKTGDCGQNAEGNHLANADDSAICGVGHNQHGVCESASVEKTGENPTCKMLKYYA
jgi:hypothetical protein